MIAALKLHYGRFLQAFSGGARLRVTSKTWKSVEPSRMGQNVAASVSMLAVRAPHMDGRFPVVKSRYLLNR